MWNSNKIAIFVGMIERLPEYIKQNDELRQILLSQEGGIMKYLAEHLDSNGTAELFSDYQNHCVEIFFERNKWVYYKVWEGDDMRKAALGQSEHLRKELNYYTALKPQLLTMPNEVAERVDWFVDLYLTHAYQLDRKRRFPHGQTDTEVYREVIDLYSSQGLAYKCMNLILKEHHAAGKKERTEGEIWKDFLVRQWSDQFTLGAFAQMRNAVAEMLTGKEDKQCRQMAIDTLERLRGFSQKIYTDVVVEHYRKMGYSEDADQRERDGEWLREVAERAVLEEFSDKNKPHSLRYYFADFVNILKDVGRIWAAQLLVHNTDLKDLEKDVCCILNPSDNLRYYVDRYYTNDLPGRYCISNDEQAEGLLKKMGHEPLNDSYLESIDQSLETKTITILSKAYNVLKEEGFVCEKTKQLTFVHVLMRHEDKKIVWLNDSKKTILLTLIKVFLGRSNTYKLQAILKLNKKTASYATFVQNHFVDKSGKPILLKTNGNEVGKKQFKQMDSILSSAYGVLVTQKRVRR